MRSNPLIKAADSLAGRLAFAVLGAHNAVRRRVSTRYRDASVGDAVTEIVAIKLCCLGDGILAVPALRALKRRWPQARLHVVCTPRSEEAFAFLPFVDELEVLPITGMGGMGEMLRRGWETLPILRRLRRLAPAVAVDLDLYFKATPVLAYLTGAPVRVGFDTPGTDRAGLFTATAGRPPDEWELQCFLNVVALLGAPTDDCRLEFPLTPQATDRATELLAGIGPAGFIALCPGSSKNWPTKRWPAEHFAAVANQAWREHGLQSVIVGAGFERDLCAEVAAATEGGPLNLAGVTSVRETGAVLARARALVTNDTGPMHLACAVGTPVVAIFGPTNDGKWGPRSERDALVTHAACDCRPCYHLSYMPDCEHRRCLLEIPAERVTAALDAILKAAPTA